MMNMNPSDLKKTWVLVSTDLSAPQCFFNQYVEIDMPYSDFIVFSEQQRKCIVEAEMSKLGYVLENRNNITLDVTNSEFCDKNLSAAVDVMNEIVEWCDHSFKRGTDRHYNQYETRYIGEQLVEAVNKWKALDIQEAYKNYLRDLTKDRVKYLQDVSKKLNAMLNGDNNCAPKETLESTKEQIDKVLERINEKLSIISM